MKNLASVLVASLTLAATSSLFGVTIVPQPIGLASPTGSDTTYTLDSPTPGFSGWITLDSSSGSWDYSGTGTSPIVDYYIQIPSEAPEPGFKLSSFESPFIFTPGDSQEYVPIGTLEWSSQAITYMNITLLGDPNIQIVGSGSDIGLDVTYDDYRTFDGIGGFSAPDAGATWLMLAGVCAAFAAYPVLHRRGMKLS
jgi:hypothetical protein